jgi:hypothetical protein
VILRRITDKLIQQNWSMLVLELLVLVAGIFLGFQLDGWNEDRKDRVLEARYVERLHLETEFNLAEVSAQVRMLLERAAILRNIAKKLEAGLAEGISVADAEMTFCYWYVTEDVKIRTATVDELIATGNITLLRNERLREQVQLVRAETKRVTNDVAVAGSVLPGVASVLQPYIRWHGSAARSDVDNVVIEANCSTDLAAMAGNVDAISALWQLYRGQMILATVRGDQMRTLERLLEEFASPDKT